LRCGERQSRRVRLGGMHGAAVATPAGPVHGRAVEDPARAGMSRLPRHHLNEAVVFQKWG